MCWLFTSLPSLEAEGFVAKDDDLLRSFLGLFSWPPTSSVLVSAVIVCSFKTLL